SHPRHEKRIGSPSSLRQSNPERGDRPPPNRPNISAGLNQQRRHMAADKTGCASDEDMLSDEKMMKIVRDHAERTIAGTRWFRARMTSAGKSISIHGTPVTSSYPNRRASTSALKTSS